MMTGGAPTQGQKMTATITAFENYQDRMKDAADAEAHALEAIERIAATDPEYAESILQRKATCERCWNTHGRRSMCRRCEL